MSFKWHLNWYQHQFWYQKGAIICGDRLRPPGTIISGDRQPGTNIGVGRPDQIIPMPSQLLQEIRRREKVADGAAVCPGPRSGNPVSRESIEKAYRVTLGYRDKHFPHSWRSAFSTLAHDAGLDHMAIEMQLDHIIPGVAGVYTRGQRLEIRKTVVQWWEDQLLG